MHVRRWITSLLAVTLLLPPPAIAQAAVAPSREPIPTWITLITGDRVLVKTPERVIFQPAPDSPPGGAFIARSGGHTFVVPRAVLPDVAAGRLDRQLFDITALLAERYDDAHSSGLPVIVSYAGSPSAARARARAATLRGTASNRVLTSIGARAATVRKSTATAFLTSAKPAARIWLDRRVDAVIDRSVPQIGAPAAWQRGYTGSGVKVAVLDTGIDTTHPDLAGKVAASANFSGTADAIDHHGHGTHVAGTIAGSDATYRGVAPDATLLNGKVLDDNGGGTQSGVIAGMEWAAAQGADVVNMSLGSGTPSDGTDPLSQALNQISQQSGALFVVAAGNCFGPAPESIGSPGAADAALTVANLHRDGSLNNSSCLGPRTGDHHLKPEIAAPGTDIVAARAAGTDIGIPVGDRYTTLTGTSMATPHVAGTAALLAQAESSLTGAQLKSRLISTADPQSGSDVTGQGAGRVDADQATGGGITTDTAELELGELPENQPVTRTVAYHNPGSTPVTLNLTAVMDPDDGPAPQLSADSVVVPAGGQTSVSVTVTPAPGNADHSGRILATPATGDPIVTTFGWFVASGTHRLTIKAVNRDRTRPSGVVMVSQMDGSDRSIHFMENGQVETRVPSGTYDVAATFDQEPSDAGEHSVTLGTVPDLEITAATTVNLDGKEGRPARLGVRGKPGLWVRNQGLGRVRTAQDGTTVSLSAQASGNIPMYVMPAPAARIGAMEFSTGGRLQLPAYAARTLAGKGIEVLPYPVGPRFTGTRTLRTVDAGTANPDELTAVRGKLAIIRRTPAKQIGEQVMAAQQAGAAAVIAYDPSTPYMPIELFEPAGATIPTMLTRRTDARWLLAHLGTLVRITGVAVSPYAYDLMLTHDRTPADPAYTAEQSEFAQVDESFNATGPDARVSHTRLGFTPHDVTFGLIEFPRNPAPLRHTSFVLGGSTRWMPQLAIDNLNLESEWFGTERVYRPGQRTSDRWFGPVQNAGLPAGGADYQGVPQHEVALRESVLGVNLAPFMQRDKWEFASLAGTHALKVFRNGELLRESPSSSTAVSVPPGTADYRIELDSQRDLPWWRTSTRVRSAWNVRYAGGELLPLVLADIDVPFASPRNEVRVGVPTRIDLGFRHQHGSAGSRVTSAKLEISYDATTWTELPLTSGGTAVVTHPVDKAGKAVHLRLDVRDENGGQLTQEVTRAYTLIR